MVNRINPTNYNANESTNQVSYKKPNLLPLAFFSFGSVILILSGFIFDEGQVAYTIGIVIMGFSLYLMQRVTKDKWSSKIGIAHVVLLILYHGVGMFLYGLFPDTALYRSRAGVTNAELAEACFVASIGIFSFALSYVLYFLAKPKKPEQKNDEFSPNLNTLWLSKLSLKILFLWTLLIVVYRSGGFYIFQQNRFLYYWLDVFFNYLSIPVIILYFIVMLYRFTLKGHFSQLALSSMVLILGFIAFMGVGRQEVLVIFVVCFVLSIKWQLLKTNKGLTLIIILFIVLLFSAVAIIRGIFGRAALQETSFSDRVSIYQELGGQDVSKGFDTLITDLGYRLGANVFIAAINNSPIDVHQTLTTEQYGIPFTLILPSSIWADKLELPATLRNVKHFTAYKLMLPVLDYLVTPLGLFYATGGYLIMIPAMAAMGVVAAFVDERSTKIMSLWGGVLSVCVAISFGWVEKDITVWFLSFRNALLLIVILYVVSIFKMLIQSVGEKY